MKKFIELKSKAKVGEPEYQTFLCPENLAMMTRLPENIGGTAIHLTDGKFLVVHQTIEQIKELIAELEKQPEQSPMKEFVPYQPTPNINNPVVMYGISYTTYTTGNNRHDQ